MIVGMGPEGDLGMYIEEDPVPVVEGFGFGEATPAPWYTKPEAVTTFLMALQASLGVPQTGVWDTATHAALWNWVMAREAVTSPGGVSDMPATLPWKQEICDADGFPVTAHQTAQAQAKDEPVTGCLDATALIGESLDHYIENNPALVAALGWPSVEAMRSDGMWNEYKTPVGVNIMAHIRSKLGTSPVTLPEPCPEGQWRSADGTCVPLVAVTPVATVTPWYKSRGAMAAGVGLGVVAVLGVGIAMSMRRR